MTKQNTIHLEEIHQHTAVIEMETIQTLAKVRAEQRRNVNVISANNIKHLAEVRSQGRAAIIRAEAEAYKNK